MNARVLTWQIRILGADHVLVYVPPNPPGEASFFALDGVPLALDWKGAPTRASVRSGVRADIATFRIDGHRAALYRISRPSGCSGWLSSVLMAVLALGGAMIVDAIYASRTLAEPVDVEFRLEVDGHVVPGELLPAYVTAVPAGAGSGSVAPLLVGTDRLDPHGPRRPARWGDIGPDRSSGTALPASAAASYGGAGGMACGCGPGRPDGRSAFSPPC